MLTELNIEKMPSNLHPVTNGTVQRNSVALSHAEEPAHMISSEQEALKVAPQLAASFEQEAAPQDIADRIVEFLDIGVTAFLLQFHPMIEEMERFGETVVLLLAKAGAWKHPALTVVGRNDAYVHEAVQV
jgi:hypothetical protein